MKEWLPRLCEALVVDDMKENIIEAVTKFQIGGKPLMRTQFLLLLLKHHGQKSKLFQPCHFHPR